MYAVDAEILYLFGEEVIMKSIVTGSSGFIGQHLCQRLEQMGHEVVRLKQWETYNKPFDYFFHLAGYGNHSQQTDVNEMKKANIDLLWMYLQDTKITKYKAFVNFSTSSMELPIQTVYSITKKAGEQLARVFAKINKKSIISVRPFSVYGPGEADFRFIPTVIRSIVRNELLELTPTPYHDWIYVEDFVNALIFCADHYTKITQWAIPIGTGIQTTNNSIVWYISDIMEKSPKIKYQENMRIYDTHQWVADTRIFHWNTRSLEEGLRETIDFYKQKYENNTIT